MKNLRNVAIIAHVDHGKTTMSDSLLADSGIISPSSAGTALALDYMKQEQERGITIVSAAVTTFWKNKCHNSKNCTILDSALRYCLKLASNNQDEHLKAFGLKSEICSP